MALGLVRRVAALLSKAGIVKTILGRDAQAFPKLCLPGLSRRAALGAGDAGGAALCGRPDDHAVRAKLSAQELAAKATQDAAIWEALAAAASDAIELDEAATQDPSDEPADELLARVRADQAAPSTPRGRKRAAETALHD